MESDEKLGGGHGGDEGGADENLGGENEGEEKVISDIEVQNEGEEEELEPDENFGGGKVGEEELEPHENRVGGNEKEVGEVDESFGGGKKRKRGRPKKMVPKGFSKNGQLSDSTRKQMQGENLGDGDDRGKGKVGNLHMGCNLLSHLLFSRVLTTL